MELFHADITHFEIHNTWSCWVREPWLNNCMSLDCRVAVGGDTLWSLYVWAWALGSWPKLVLAWLQDQMDQWQPGAGASQQSSRPRCLISRSRHKSGAVSWEKSDYLGLVTIRHVSTWLVSTGNWFHSKNLFSWRLKLAASDVIARGTTAIAIIIFIVVIIARH